MMRSRLVCALGALLGLGLGLLGPRRFSRAQSEPKRPIPLSTSKLLLAPVPGEPQRTNSFPTAIALSPDGRYVALLNNGYGTEESGFAESIAVLDTQTGRLSDYPDQRLDRHAHQTYFLGLAFSPDGARVYASMASLTDAAGTVPGDAGNGIAVFKFSDGRPTPDRFIRIPAQTLALGKNSTLTGRVPAGKAVPYPAGLVAFRAASGERLLVADNLSDDALLIDAESGQVLSRFDLSTHPDVPASYPYGVAVTRDGRLGYCTLWNASAVAELDLSAGRVVRLIPLLAPLSPTAAGSHPTALVLAPDEKRLYVALANADRVAAIDTATGQVAGMLSTELPGQQYGGSVPNALAVDPAGTRLFVADASADAVAVFDLTGSLDPGNTEAADGDGVHPHRVVPDGAGGAGRSPLRRVRQGRGHRPQLRDRASRQDHRLLRSRAPAPLHRVAPPRIASPGEYRQGRGQAGRTDAGSGRRATARTRSRKRFTSPPARIPFGTSSTSSKRTAVTTRCSAT